jgi:coenzyme F420-reducing hydrogenase alpha subunit
MVLSVDYAGDATLPFNSSMASVTLLYALRLIIAMMVVDVYDLCRACLVHMIVRTRE